MSKKIHIPSEVTIGDKYRPAMKITEPEEAEQYLEACVLHSMTVSGCSRERAVKTEKANLAGYYDNETRERVERLFHCSHPIFGRVSDGMPTPQEAFDAGKKLAAEQPELMKET